MNYNFKKVHTGKDYTVSGIILAGGIALYFLAGAGLGITAALCGLLALIFLKSGYKAEGSDVLLTKKAFDVAFSCRASLKDYLDGKDVEPEVKQPENGGVVRLEAYFNRSEALAYAQLFDFSSYSYEPATEVVELHGAKAEKLINKL